MALPHFVIRKSDADVTALLDFLNNIKLSGLGFVLAETRSSNACGFGRGLCVWLLSPERA
jgi:hypothetical protein